MPLATIHPNERFALIGKTRAGKTSLAMVISATFATALIGTQWEVWWIDTKGDLKDIKDLRRWGFRNAASSRDRGTPGALPNAMYFKIDSQDGESNDIDVVSQAQAIFAAAYRRGYVLVVVDEYTSVVPSARNPGKALQDIFTRGGGRNVGIIGLTQEPVYVPRQLLSQATHQVLLSLSHAYDIKYVKTMEPAYESPNTRGDKYGFFWKWVDGSGEVTYYPNQQKWYKQLKIALPKLVMDPSDGEVRAS